MTERNDEYKHLRSIADDPPRGKFVALSDGMTSLFREENGQLYSVEGIKCISWFRQQEDGTFAPVETDIAMNLAGRGYSHWIALPEDFKFWWEA